jgi:5-formyltetrahydrofolate cyclo-ligase
VNYSGNEYVMDAKENLRKKILQIRDAIPKALRDSKSRTISEYVTGLPEFKNAKTVMCFSSIGSEPDTAPILASILESGKNLVLPKVLKKNKRIAAYVVKKSGDLTPGVWGILEPNEHCQKADISTIDMVIVPGIAFDPDGGRLGYGGGYYDRFIETLDANIYLLGIAFREQIIERIPMESHDKYMNKVLTD